MKLPSACLIALLVASGAHAAPPDPKTPTPAGRPDVVSPVLTGTRGIAGSVYVGEAAPGFELSNFAGEKVRLSSFAGDRVMLCFADRREMLSSYRAAADSLLGHGIRLVGIARDSPRALRALAQRDSLRFELLSDPTGEVSAMYGSYDFGTSNLRSGYVLIGRTGIVRLAWLGQRLPPDDLLRITRYALTSLQ